MRFPASLSVASTLLNLQFCWKIKLGEEEIVINLLIYKVFRAVRRKNAERQGFEPWNPSRG